MAIPLKKFPPQNKLVCNTSNTKSVSSYLKQLARDDFIKNEKVLIGANTDVNISKKQSSSLYTGNDSYESTSKQLVSELDEENIDPINLKNILNALKCSSKGKRKGKLSEKNNDSTGNQRNDLCDFKFIGDISQLSLDSEVSFQRDYDNKEEISCTNISFEIENTSLNNSVRLDEDYSPEIDDSIFSLKDKLVKSRLSLHEDRNNEKLVRTIHRREEYLEKLHNIRESAASSLQEKLLQEDQIRLENEANLQSQFLQASQEAVAAEETYAKNSINMKKKLLQDIEVVLEQKTAHINALISNFQELHEILEQKTAIAQQSLTENEKGTELYTFFCQNLPLLIAGNANFIATLNRQASSAEELILAKTENIQQILEFVQEFQILSNEHKTAVKASEPIVETPPPAPVTEPQIAAPAAPLQPQPPPEVSQPVPPKEVTVVPQRRPACEQRFAILKAKYDAVVMEAEPMRSDTRLRPLLSRTVGIVNQLNSAKHDSSNRGKLQQLINLISGRTCTIGVSSVTTKDNGPALAFVKEQLASKLISLSHDIQASTMDVYASLVVRLWQLYPDLGDLLLLKLFETCPFLVPMTVTQQAGQREESFNRALGFKHKDGGVREPMDSYLTRMGNAARLYGRIVAMNVESHPHGLLEGWTWLAHTLDKEPFPSVTATLLNGFLWAAGNALQTRYGQQFRKLLHFICTSYLALMESESLEGGAAVMASLKNLLQNYLVTGSIPPPEEGYGLLI